MLDSEDKTRLLYFLFTLKTSQSITSRTKQKAYGVKNADISYLDGKCLAGTTVAILGTISLLKIRQLVKSLLKKQRSANYKLAKEIKKCIYR